MEYLDIINDNDEAIGQCTVSESYNKFLPHRIIHILIFNDKGKMLLQKRTAKENFAQITGPRLSVGMSKLVRVTKKGHFVNTRKSLVQQVNLN